MAVAVQVSKTVRRSWFLSKTAKGAKGRMSNAAWIIENAANSSFGMVRSELSKRLVATCPQGTTIAKSKAEIYKIIDRQLIDAP
jgi:hypothetical protein